MGGVDRSPCWPAWSTTRGLAVTVVLAVLLFVVAIGVYLPRSFANATVALAALIALTFLGGG